MKDPEGAVLEIFPEAWCELWAPGRWLVFANKELERSGRAEGEGTTMADAWADAASRLGAITGVRKVRSVYPDAACIGENGVLGYIRRIVASDGRWLSDNKLSESEAWDDAASRLGPVR